MKFAQQCLNTSSIMKWMLGVVSTRMRDVGSCEDKKYNIVLSSVFFKWLSSWKLVALHICKYLEDIYSSVARRLSFCTSSDSVIIFIPELKFS